MLSTQRTKRSTTLSKPQKKRTGLALQSPERRKEIASLGGKTARQRDAARRERIVQLEAQLAQQAQKTQEAQAA
jgi:hypothetical protein